LILGRELVTDPERKLAKAFNFGLLYGMGEATLVTSAKNEYGVPLTLEQAKKFRARFFNAYVGLKRWHLNAEAKAKAGAKEVRTIIGRRRLLPPGPDDWWKRFSQLLNTPVQGGSADALKLAMIEIAQLLPSGAGIVSTVHDELIVETPEDKAEETKRLVEECMKRAMEQLFPEVRMKVEAKICGNWGEK
jgi:DNA polymerase-1